MDYEVDAVRRRGRPEKTWRQVVEKDCQIQQLNKDSKWRK